MTGSSWRTRGIVILLFLLFLFPLIAFDRQAAVGELHLDVLLVEARQLGRDFVGVILLDDVDELRTKQGRCNLLALKR